MNIISNERGNIPTDWIIAFFNLDLTRPTNIGEDDEDSVSAVNRLIESSNLFQLSSVSFCSNSKDICFAYSSKA